VYRPTRHPGCPGIPSFQRLLFLKVYNPQPRSIVNQSISDPAINQDTPRFPRLLVPRETARSRDKPRSPAASSVAALQHKPGRPPARDRWQHDVQCHNVRADAKPPSPSPPHHASPRHDPIKIRSFFSPRGRKGNSVRSTAGGRSRARRQQQLAAAAGEVFSGLAIEREEISLRHIPLACKHPSGLVCPRHAHPAAGTVTDSRLRGGARREATGAGDG
jgi:hypothetical protein